MTRQSDLAQEDRETARRQALVRCLEWGLVGALERQGIELIGIAIRYGEFDCLMTLKADVNARRHVCFVGAETIMSCFLKAESAALGNRLHWRADKYHQTED